MSITPSSQDTAVLQAEIDRLQSFIREYGESVTRKLDSIEECSTQLEAENQRLITAKETMRIERDACISLLAKLALAQGLTVGATEDNSIVVELPSGQVSWKIAESETHLLDGLPVYTQTVQELELQETYTRVMNPGISGT